MLFVLSKVLFFFAAPAHFCLLLAIVGGVLAAWTGRTWLAKRLIGLGLAGLVVFGFSPVSSFMLNALEQRFPPATDIDRGNYAGIILLGGFEDNRISEHRQALVLIGSAERLTETARLAHRMPSAKVIFTGGSATIVRNVKSAGGAIAQYFQDIGIPSSRIVIENRSRNTWENAVFTRSMIKPRPGDRYLLVTSAWHMPRSIGVFRKAGFDVSPWPVDYRSAGGSDLFLPYLRMSDGLDSTNLAAKEMIGLVAYWLAGRTSAVFPAAKKPAT